VRGNFEISVRQTVQQCLNTEREFVAFLDVEVKDAGTNEHNCPVKAVRFLPHRHGTLFTYRGRERAREKNTSDLLSCSFQ
jgi:hypothetical protein